MNERLETLPQNRALALAALAIFLLAGMAGCARRRADAAPVAPPAPIPARAPASEPPPGPLSEPQTRAELPPPQAVPEGAAPNPHGPFAHRSQEPAEEPARPKTSSPPPRTVAEAPRTPAKPVSEPATAASVPQLGPILSDQQRQVFETEIERNLEQTRTALNTLMSRNLSADQVEGVRRIREFLRQVAESRETDAALARNLSERARLLAEDLVRNTR